MTGSFLVRETGRDVHSIQTGTIVAIEGAVIFAKMEGVAGRVEFDRDEFSDFDIPKLKVGARLRFETGRNRSSSSWGSYTQVNVEG